MAVPPAAVREKLEASIGSNGSFSPSRLLESVQEGCLALASALCAGLMIGPQRRKPPAVNRDFGPGCIQATHFGKNDSPQFSSLRDQS